MMNLSSMLLEERVAVRLRVAMGDLPVSNDELIKQTKASFLQASIRLGLAVDDLWANIKSIF